MLQPFLVSILVAFAVGTTISGSDLDWNTRIVIGQNASTLRFPYLAAIYFHHSGSNLGSSCDGSILNRQWVLTAAQCTYGYQPDEVKVIVGGGIVRLVDRIEIHPKYISNSLENDVALIRTEKYVFFSAYVQPIRIRMLFDVDGGVPVIASGWGLTNPTVGSSPDNLQWLKTKTISNRDCYNYHGLVTDTLLCTIAGMREASCFGNPGGPLVLGRKLVGISSHGAGNCSDGAPLVFTRASSFVKWIDDQIYPYRPIKQ